MYVTCVLVHKWLFMKVYQVEALNMNQSKPTMQIMLSFKTVMTVKGSNVAVTEMG